MKNISSFKVKKRLFWYRVFTYQGFLNIIFVVLAITLIAVIGYATLGKSSLSPTTKVISPTHNQDSSRPLAVTQNDSYKLTYKQYLSKGKYYFEIFVNDSNIYDSPNTLSTPAQVIKTVNPNVQILWPNGGIDMYIVNLQAKKVLPIIYKGAVSPTYIAIILEPSWSLTTGKSLAITTLQSAWNRDNTQITDLALNNKPVNVLDTPINVHRPKTREVREARDYEETVKLTPTGVSEDLTKLYFSLVIKELKYRKNFSLDIGRNEIKAEPNSGILLPVPDLESLQ